jgi:hypothetical protein
MIGAVSTGGQRAGGFLPRARGEVVQDGVRLLMEEIDG